MAAPNKTQLLGDVQTILKKKYKSAVETAPKLTVLEAVVLGICQENVGRERAEQALARFKSEYFDWNEVRVSSITQIQAVLRGMPDAAERANRIRRFLRQLFEKTYGFTLEAVTKKPLKESVKQLEEYEAFKSDYVLASVIVHSLGGHAIPIDSSMRRVLERLGVAAPDIDSTALRNTLERAVPKNRGPEFVDLVRRLAHDLCREDAPDCARCDLRKSCPSGIARLSAPASKKSSASASAAAAAPSSEAAPSPAPSKPKKAEAGAKESSSKPKPAAKPAESPSSPAKTKAADTPASTPAKPAGRSKKS